MRQINHIVIHCTATQPTATVKGILNYWKNTLKWKNPGYHYLIEPNGEINHLQDEKCPSNGVRGHNPDSIHVSYIGGVDRDNKTPKDTRTVQQIEAMTGLVRTLKDRYPNADILGHRDFPGVAKACPSFNVKEWVAQSRL